MNLYQITSEYEQILDHLYDDEGNLDATALILLDDKKLEINEKAVAIASYIKNLDAERIAIDNAKMEMAAREQRYKRKIEGLEFYLKDNMERCGITSIKHPYFDIKLKKCPSSVDIDDMDLLPTEYKRFKMEVSADKQKIKREMQAGVVVPGVTLKNNLRVEIK